MDRELFINVLVRNKSINRSVKLDKIQQLVILTLNNKGLIIVGKNNYVIHMGTDKYPIQGLLYGLISGIYDLCEDLIDEKKKLEKINKVING